MFASDRIDTLIGAGTRIDGDISFSGGLRIDGEVRGHVTARPGSPSVLVIGEHGRVRGDVRADRMVANGYVTGATRVTGLVELQPCARISGELRYGALEIHRGAVIEAELVREAPAAAAARAPEPPEAVLRPAASPA